MARWAAFEGMAADGSNKLEEFGLFLDVHKVKVIKRRGNIMSIYMDDDFVETINFTNKDNLNDMFHKLAEAIAG